jgi:hypothetical protein
MVKSGRVLFFALLAYFWWKCAEQNSPFEICKRMFNVMLVGRKDDIAHRLGIEKIYIDD